MSRFMRWVRLMCTCLLRVFLDFLFLSGHRARFGRQKATTNKKLFYRRKPKPAWVIHEVIRLKALMPENGCRKTADIFNRRFAQDRGMTVGKSFVNDAIRKHAYEIQVLRREIKNRKPKSVPMNLVWGMDLTGKTDSQGNLIHILGIVEHKSRLSLGLAVLKDKSSITILRTLLDVIERYGKPRFLRTDNESVFTSGIFKFSLWLMRIRHQTIDKACPWQNGRIERFFGTLKEKLDKWQADNTEQLSGALVQFRFWYNHVRPHQSLDGKTPVEVWRGIDVFAKKPKREYWLEAWDGLLTGFYLEH